MFHALLWNLVLTAGLAVVLFALCRVPWLHRRPALRCWLWLLLFVKLVTPPLVDVPLLPALAKQTEPATTIVTEAAPPVYEEAKTPVVQPDLPMQPVETDPSMDEAMALPPFPDVDVAEPETPNDTDDTTVNATTSPEAAVTPAEPSGEVEAFSLGSYWVVLCEHWGILVGISLAGTLVLVVVYGHGTIRLYRWLNRAGCEDQRLTLLCEEVASVMNLRKVVQGHVVDVRTTPLLWPWGRQPRVAIPRQLFDAMETGQMQQVVAHELAHLLRRDHWSNLFVLIIKMLMWWNPIVWWADRELRIAQELCCDAIAIDCCRANRRGYATTLLQALEFIQAKLPATGTLALRMGSRRSIIRRFEMIGEKRLTYRLSRWTFLALLVLAVPLVCMPVRGQEKTPDDAAMPAASEVETTLDQKRAKEPSVDDKTHRELEEETVITKAGSSVHRDRLNQLLATLKKENLQQSVAQLKESQQYTYPSYHSGKRGEQTDLEVLLSARRVTKIAQDMARFKTREEMESQNRVFFKQSFDYYKKIIDDVLKSYEDPNAPKNKESISSAKYAVCTFMLMAALSGDIEGLAKQIDQVNQFSQEVEKRIQQNEKRFPDHFWQDIRGFIEPDNRFILNTMIYSIRNRHDRSSKEHQELRAIIKGFPIKEVPIVEWDAEMGYYDFLHVYEGAPIDPEKIYKRLLIYDWPDDIKGEKESDTLKRLRGCLLKPQAELIPWGWPEGDCSISGKVVDAETEKPVGGARVYLFHKKTFKSIFINTEPDGTFALKNISKGPYSLRTTHVPGYQDYVYSPENKPEMEISYFSLDEGEQREGLVFRLKKGYRISGKVMDENGKAPMFELLKPILITAWRQEKDGRIHYMKQSTVNAKGTYGIDGLDGEPVYVMALQWGGAQKQWNGYPPTYYPGTFFKKEAKQVTFGKERTVKNIDITLKKEGGITVEGTVRDEAGKPVPETLVFAQHTGIVVDIVGTYTDRQGHYQLRCLGDGEYHIHADALHRGFVAARDTVTLDRDHPKADHDFTLSKGITISGKFVDEEGNEWNVGKSHGHADIIEEKPGTIKHFWATGSGNKYNRIHPEPDQGGMLMIDSPSSQPTGQMCFPTGSTFLLQAMPSGRTKIDFFAKKEGETVKKILYQGKDVLKSGFETRPGEDVKDVTIVVGKEKASAKKGTAEKKDVKQSSETVYGKRFDGDCSLSGKVVSAETGKPIEGARIWLQPLSVTYRSTIVVRTEKDGVFDFKNIGDGSMKLVAYCNGYQDVSYDPNNNPNQYPKFSLKPGESRSGIVLKLEKGYCISGKVLDENGNVPKNIDSLRVSYVPKKQDHRRNKITFSLIDPKDGSYRIDKLSNEPVYVLVVGRTEAARQGRVISPTYYPSTFFHDEAKPVTFDGKREVKDANITLKKEGGLTLEGTILDKTGKPIPEAFVIVHPKKRYLHAATDYTDEQGKYRIQGLGDGDFLVHVDASHRGFVRRRMPIRLDRKQATSQLNMKLLKGITISGKMIDENGKDWPIQHFQNCVMSHGAANVTGVPKLQNSLSAEGNFGIYGFWNKHVSAEHTCGSGSGLLPSQEGNYLMEQMVYPTQNTFTISGLMPGQTEISFRPNSFGLKVKKIVYRGKDISKSGIKTKPGEDVKDVTIVIGKEKGANTTAPQNRTTVEQGASTPNTTPSPDKEQPKLPKETVFGKRMNGKCSIRGQVVDAETGKPVMGAIVHLFCLATSDALTLLPANDGEFYFSKIPEGPFLLQCSCKGYQEKHYNAKGGSKRFASFRLKPNEARSGIVFKLKRAYTISGKVLDEDGDVPKNIKTLTVRAIGQKDGDREGEPTSVNPEDGSYQIGGLDNKPVYVVATNNEAARKGGGYPPIYYPSTFFQDEAKPVAFEKERNVTNIDITLKKGGGLVLKGTVLDESGKPVPEAFVAAHRDDRFSHFVTDYTDEQGKYRLEGMDSAKYVVHVNAVHRGFVRKRTPILLDRKTPKQQLDFTLKQGVKISGKIVDEQGKVWQIPMLQNIMPKCNGTASAIGNQNPQSLLTAEPTFSLHGYYSKYQSPDRLSGFGGGKTPSIDGNYSTEQLTLASPNTFTVMGMMSGRTKIHFRPQSAGEKVIKILYQGKDVTTSGIATKPGEDVKDVTIVIGKDENGDSSEKNVGEVVVKGDTMFISGRKTTGSETEKKEPPKNEKPAKRQKETTKGQRPRGEGSLSGKVVAADTGKPIADAKVYLFYVDTYAPMFIQTANDGSFDFKDLPEGTFVLQTIRVPGYQGAYYNPEHRKPGCFQDFSLKKGEHRSDIVLKVEPACCISGTVLDENGKVPKDVDTLLVRAWYQDEEDKNYDRPIYKSMSQNVNRDGSFTIDGLNGKPIYVMAHNPTAAREGETYPPVYYPSTFFRDDAKRITFDGKKRVDNVNITLKKEGGLVLEGTVRDETGRPVPEAFVVACRQDMVYDFVTAYTDKQGKYRIEGLGNGDFLAHVDATHRDFVKKSVQFTLDRKNAKTRLDLTLAQGATVSGKVVDEQGKEWPIGKANGNITVRNIENPKEKVTFVPLKNITLSGYWSKYRYPGRLQGYGSSCSYSSKDNDGNYLIEKMTCPTTNTFLFQGIMPGPTEIEFYPKAKGKKVVKILYDGKDILESGIETRPGEEIKDVTIVIGKDENGASPKTIRSKTEEKRSPKKEEKEKPAKPQKETVVGKLPRGDCSIGGKVVDAETGKPIEGAMVSYAYKPFSRASITVPTAKDGTFHFQKLPERISSLCVSCKGYQRRGFFSEEELREIGLPERFQPGKAFSGIKIQLKQAYSVSGKVVDEKGNVPKDAGTLIVVACLQKSLQWQVGFAKVDPNDGSYELDGLSEEPVYVIASSTEDEVCRGRGRSPIFYPGTFFLKEAKPVAFDKQRHVKDVTITLKEKGGLTLEGTVRDESGKPVPEAFVVAKYNDRNIRCITDYTDSQGKYRLRGLDATTDCAVHVDANYRGFVRKRAPIQLDREKKTPPLDFTLRKGATLSGKFVDENGKDWQLPQRSDNAYLFGMIAVFRDPQVQATLSQEKLPTLYGFWSKYQLAGNICSDGGSPMYSQNGNYIVEMMRSPTPSTFVASGILPGRTDLLFRSGLNGKNVTKILYHGKDVLNTGIETKPGEEIKDITIVIGKNENANSPDIDPEEYLSLKKPGPGDKASDPPGKEDPKN